MFRKLFFVFGAMLLALSLSATANPVIHAAPDSVTVKGRINTINLRSKTVSIKKNGGTLLTLKAIATTAFIRNGVTSSLKGLSLRDTVTAVYNPSNQIALRFKAKGPAVRGISGTVTAASKSNGVVTVGKTKIQITSQTRISRNGKLVSLSSLTHKDTLVAHVQAGSNVAVDLVDDGPAEGEVRGTIAAINGNNVTIDPGNGAAQVTIIVVAGTMIEVNGENATLADLAVGQVAEAHYDPTTMNAFEIEAETMSQGEDAHIVGTVAGVDTNAGTLTVTPNGGGANVTLVVTPATEIQVNDTGATLADIQVGMPVSAEYDATSLVAFEIKAGSGDDNQEDNEVEGTVASTDLTASTITITPSNGGSPVTLNVVSDTEIEVNGENGTLADIQVGASVQAEYDTQTMNARSINVGEDSHPN